MKTQAMTPLTQKELLNISGGVAVIDPFACGGGSRVMSPDSYEEKIKWRTP
ncbi:hypothetical protein ACVRZR_05405 [Streptococcus entericus]|uniref:hypothetical protein n=1 Tax=Streptococcus entericus TaxID=155680 RepID=UPI00036404CA|nr:hypothetical protein [Streptococcus entericus]